MEVRGFVFDGAPEKIVNADSHVGVSSARIRPICDVSTGNRSGQERRAGRLRGSHLNERTVLVGGSSLIRTLWQAGRRWGHLLGKQALSPQRIRGNRSGLAHCRLTLRLFSGKESRRGILRGILRRA